MTLTRALPAALAASAILAGCDLQVPTAPPIFEPRWILAVEGTRLAVDELLPSRVTSDGAVFLIEVDPVESGRTLGALCPACGPLHGGPAAPVPPFTGNFGSETALPTDVVSAELESAVVDIEIANGFPFDPLQGGGTFAIVVSDGTGAELGRLDLDEHDAGLAPGATVVHTLVLGPGIVDGALRTRAEIAARGGQHAAIDTTATVAVTASVRGLRVASVTVDVPGRTVQLEEQSIDLEDVADEVAERIVSGSLILEVTNPFGVTVDGQIEIGGTTKLFTIPSDPASRVELTYSGDELRGFIGRPGITLSGSGTAAGRGVTIRPGQELDLDNTLDFTLRIG